MGTDRDARSSLDGFVPPWDSMREFIESHEPDAATFLIELDHDRDRRREWTSGEWLERVRAAASWLQDRGVEPGATVSVLAGNSADALAIAYGCWYLGACYVPLNQHETTDRLAFIVEDAKVGLLIAGPEHLERAVLLADPGSCALSSTEEVPTDGQVALDRVGLAAAGGLASPALRVYTSGTTGAPKGVVLTGANLLTDVDALARVLGWGAATRILTVLPVHHVNGLVISSLLPWATGSSTVLCDRFRSEHFWSVAAAEAATVCSMVPSLLEFLLATPGSRPDCFAQVLCGAGPLLPETVTAFEERFSVEVRHLYGLSETTAVVTMMPPFSGAEHHRHWYCDFGVPSIGTALPHVEVAVLGEEGQLCEAGQRGELVVRGSVVMRGYAELPEATEEALRDGWFHSGDEGMWQHSSDGQQMFFVTGRIKELFIRGGVNIAPIEVDRVLCLHPAVRFALAVPFDSRYYGEEVAAYVVAEGDVTEAELLVHCAQHLDWSHQPKVVLFGDEVPYTATGKPKRLELKQRLADRLAPYRDVQFRRGGYETGVRPAPSGTETH